MTLTIDPGDFCVPEGARVNLKKWPTHVKRAYKSKKEYHKLLGEQVDELTSLQRLHYASNGYAVLAVTGLTSNSTIFDHAIKDGEFYNDAIRRRSLADTW